MTRLKTAAMETIKIYAHFQISLKTIPFGAAHAYLYHAIENTMKEVKIFVCCVAEKIKVKNVAESAKVKKMFRRFGTEPFISGMFVENTAIQNTGKSLYLINPISRR